MRNGPSPRTKRRPPSLSPVTVVGVRVARTQVRHDVVDGDPVVHGGSDVEDRLRLNAGNGSAPDVDHRDGEVTQEGPDRGALALAQHDPFGVVRREADLRLVQSQAIPHRGPRPLDRSSRCPPHGTECSQHAGDVPLGAVAAAAAAPHQTNALDPSDGGAHADPVVAIDRAAGLGTAQEKAEVLVAAGKLVADESIALAEVLEDDALMVRVLDHMHRALHVPSLLAQSLIRNAGASAHPMRCSLPNRLRSALASAPRSSVSNRPLVR